jgi:hypothetical protein
MSRRSPLVVIVLLAALVAGCAAPSNPPPRAQAASAEREAQCRNRMYIDRQARMRSSVNWNVYDQCMRGND